MCNGATVDANILNAFTQDLIKQTESVDKQIVQRLENTHGFIIDSGGKMENQWRETCGHSNVFGEWLVQNLKKGIIRQVDAKLPVQHKKKLQQDCGMPIKREIMYVAVANVSDLKYIVTNDIDFWDPTSKKGKADQHERIKRERRGAVCKYLSKFLAIRVGTPTMALAEL